MGVYTDFVRRYAKGHLAVVGTVVESVLYYGNDFCGSIWPSVAGVLGTVLVILVPNKSNASK
jgi:hypothetical protein